MKIFRKIVLGVSLVVGMAPNLRSESEPIEAAEVSDAPYAFNGRLFAGVSESSGKQSGSGVAVGPGVVLTAAHVYWTEAWGEDDTSLPEGASPWLAYREWYPQASSSSDEGYDNVVSVVSLAGYDDVLHEYDENRNDGTSPFEAFNRDSLLLIFSDNEATPHGYLPIHPRAVESGLMGRKNFYEVIGYPSAKYFGSDSRKWLMHKTLETEPIVLNTVPSSVYDGGYSFANRLFFGGEPLDSYAGNSGGPVVVRTQADEPWVLSGVYVGSNALIRCADEELSAMVDTAIAGQFEADDPRFRFTSSAITVGEGDGSLTIGVERLGDASSGAIVALEKVDFLTDQGSDYGDLGSLFWAEGESGIKELSLAIEEDELREGAESFMLRLNVVDAEVDGPGSLHVTIEDNDLNQPLDGWTTIDEVGAVHYSEVVFGKGVFASIGLDNAVYWTPDYSETGVVEFPGINRLFQLIYAKGYFVGSGDGPQIVVSENGRDWEIVELPTSVSIMSIQYGQGLFVGVGGIDALSASQGEIWVSEDTRNWTKVYDENHARFDDVEFGNGYFLALADEDFYRSTDGRTWVKLEIEGLEGEAGDFEFGAGRFVNAGRQGQIYYSTDGVQWTLAREADEETYYGVGYRNGYFVATGITGKLATSEDGGVTWIDRFPPTSQSLWHGITALGKMVVIGDNGHLMEALLPEYYDYRLDLYDKSVGEGDPVNFIAEFESSEPGPYSFQWQKDGVDIPGETEPSLSISAVGPDDAGEYQVIASVGGQEYPSSMAVLDIKLRINPPANLVATTATSRGVTLDWKDDSLGEAEYRIERRLVGETSWKLVGAAGPNSDRFVARQLTPDTDYEFRVVTISDGDPAISAVVQYKTLSATNMVNLSTRGLVGSGDRVMIGGFIIPPGPDMTLYIRGLGPSLESSGISNTISDPKLSLVQTNEEEGVSLVNGDWMDSPDLQAILDTGIPPTTDEESAILVTLSPGAYTAVLENEADEGIGIGMIEVYDATQDCSECRLVNLSTRAYVGDESELVIGGLIVRGEAEKEVMVRVVGPSLNLPESLGNPQLRLFADGLEVGYNDDWQSSSNAQVFRDVGLPLGDDLEAGEVMELNEGQYTFHVSGETDQTGIALLEIYELE